MNTQNVKPGAGMPVLVKADPSKPALIVTGRDTIAIRAGTTFAGVSFEADTPVVLTPDHLVPGGDYVVILKDGKTGFARLTSPSIDVDVLGGFHFAPGGNAAARNGGDELPVINPFSLWDVNFRPACPDPRGMALIDGRDGRFWCDIYLTGTKHLTDGTSKLGATIADGRDLPQKPGGEKFKAFDYAAAVELHKYHGKGLLSFDEFIAAAYGVTERTSVDEDPEDIKLDAARTSKFGLMQATGNMWVWGHDGDPDMPRASIFGGCWAIGDYAGSRLAYVGFYWPVDSFDILGARGRSDHLQLG